MSIENNGINPGTPSPQGPKKQGQPKPSDEAIELSTDDVIELDETSVVSDSELTREQLHAKYKDERAAETQEEQITPEDVKRAVEEYKKKSGNQS